MCGIAGYITSKENARETQARFNNILVQAEVRGTDACGIAFVVNRNRFFYAKAPKRASKFITEKGYKDLMEKYNPTMLIGHNRQKTRGDQANNMNNHPIVTKTGLALIHNGVLRNEDELFKKYGLPRDAEVDSEVIVRLIEYYIGKGKDTIKAIQLASKKIEGSMAIALLNDKEPRTMYLVSRGNPVNLAYHIPTGTIYFASTEDILRNGLMTYNSYFNRLFWVERGQNEYAFKELDTDTGIKITKRGWEEFEVEEPDRTTTYATSTSRDEKYGSYHPSAKPIEVEKGTEDEIQEALEECTDFDVFDRVHKPSRYLSELLIYRLEYLQELFVSGDYIYHTEEDGYEINKLREEVRRIINTLEHRKAKTKRSDIIIPEFNDIWLLDNPRYKTELQNEQCIKTGFRSIKWILTHENPELRDMLDKAGILDGRLAEKKNEGEYYCTACKALKEYNYCEDCGDNNLDSIDDLMDKEAEKEAQQKLLN